MKGNRDLPEPFYRIKVPSVTTIISEMVCDPDFEAFIQSVGKERADQIMQAAAYKGTSMHTFIENFITHYHKTKDISEALKYTQVQSIEVLKKENIPEIKIKEGRELFYKFYYSEHVNKFLDLIGVEIGIYSPTYFYRGKLDILHNDSVFKISVTDLKSAGSYIKKGSVKELKYKLQLGAYALALEDMKKDSGLIVNKASVLCVTPTSDILQEIVIAGNELLKYKEEFKTLVKEYHIINKQEYLLQNLKS